MGPVFLYHTCIGGVNLISRWTSADRLTFFGHIWGYTLPWKTDPRTTFWLCWWCDTTECKNGEKPTNKMRCGGDWYHTRNRLGLEVSGSDPSPEGCGFTPEHFSYCSEILYCFFGVVLIHCFDVLLLGLGNDFCRVMVAIGYAVLLWPLFCAFDMMFDVDS